MSAGHLLLDIEATPEQEGHVSPIHLALGNALVAVRADDGTVEMFDARLVQENDLDETEPYDWESDSITREFIAALAKGNAQAIIVDPESPNVDVDNQQFRILGSADGPIEVSVTDTILKGGQHVVIERRAGDENPIEVSVVGETIVGGVEVEAIRTPYDGPGPLRTPFWIEVNEVPARGRYRSRRWVDHTHDFAEVSWQLNAGSISQSSLEMRPVDRPRR